MFYGHSGGEATETSRDKSKLIDHSTSRARITSAITIISISSSSSSSI